MPNVRSTPSPLDPGVQEIRERVLRKPEVLWQPPSLSSPVLEFRLVSQVEPSRIDEIMTLAGPSAAVDRAGLASTVLAVVQGLDRRRVTAVSAGAFGKGITLLTCDGIGALFLDDASCTYLQMSPDQVAPLSDQGFVETLWRTLPPDPEAQGLAVVEIDVLAPRRARARLWLDPSPALRPYTRGLVGVALGCPQKMAASGLPVDAVLELGTPVRGHIFLDNGAQDWAERPLVRFEIESPVVRPAAQEEFALPPGYSDLRNPAPPAPNNGLVPAGGPAPARVAASARARARTASRETLAGRPAATFAAPGTDNINVPQCISSTFGAVLGAEVEQGLADDIQVLVNAVGTRLRGFRGDHGKVLINWLDQLKLFHDTSPPDGDGVYCLLHDEMKGKALLDSVAAREAADMLRRGEIHTDLVLPPALLVEIAAIFGNPGIAPADRFTALSAASQTALRDAYLFQILGTFRPTYPASTDPALILYDLLYIKIDNLEFDIVLNDGSGPPSLLRKLEVDRGAVNAEIELAEIQGQAILSRWPSALFSAVIFLGPFCCWIIPGACALLPLISSVGLFLALDLGVVNLRLPKPDIRLRVEFVPSPGTARIPAGTLVPKATFQLLSPIEVRYLSLFPDGIHQVVDAVLALVASKVDDVRHAAESLVSDQISTYLAETLAITFPPDLGPVRVPAFASRTDGAPADHIYLEASLNAGLTGIAGPFVTQVEAYPGARLIAGRHEFADKISKDGSLPLAQHIGGFAMSQNFLNLYINGLWKKGEFNAMLSPPLTKDLVDALQLLRPTYKVTPPYQAHLWPAASPRVVFTPRGEAEGKGVLTAFFDDLRLCVSGSEAPDVLASVVEYQFAAQVRAAIGFGGRNADTGKLDLIKVSDRLVDVYFDLTGAGTSIVHPELEGVAWIAEGLDGLSPASLGALEPLFLRAVTEALQSRSAAWLPRNPGDPENVLSYQLRGKTIQARIETQAARGTLYGYIALWGPGLLLLTLLSSPFSCKSARALLELDI